MNNIAEICGGVGVAIMTFQTQFEKEFATLQEMQDRLAADGPTILGKLAEINKTFAAKLDKLQKGATRVERLKAENDALREYIAEQGKLRADLERYRQAYNEALKQIGKCHEVFPDFAKHIHGPHVMPQLFLVTKGLDSFDGDMARATEAGAIVELGPRKQPTPDPTSNLGATYLSRRSDI
jgi:hypothetical protein